MIQFRRLMQSVFQQSILKVCTDRLCAQVTRKSAVCSRYTFKDASHQSLDRGSCADSRIGAVRVFRTPAARRQVSSSGRSTEALRVSTMVSSSRSAGAVQ